MGPFAFFQAQVFGLKGANIEMNMMCIESGQGETVLFMSEDSTYTDVSNYINPDVQSNSCQDARDGRLVQENMNSGCFDSSDSSPCSIGCARFGTATECSATMAPTASPSARSVSGVGCNQFIVRERSSHIKLRWFVVIRCLPES